MNNKCLMLRGAGLTFGKSLLTAAFGRIFKEEGYSTAPFKAQHMVLNSFIAAAGAEMGMIEIADGPLLLTADIDKAASLCPQLLEKYNLENLRNKSENT